MLGAIHRENDADHFKASSSPPIFVWPQNASFSSRSEVQVNWLHIEPGSYILLTDMTLFKYGSFNQPQTCMSTTCVNDQVNNTC